MHFHKTRLTLPLVAALLAIAAAPALADSAGSAAPDLPHHGMRPFGMGTVKNAPYSAQAINERQQILADGNQISQRRDSATWYRDAAGRTRLEVRGKDGELRLVTLHDPVAGATWTLDPRKHSALKFTRRRTPDGQGGAAGTLAAGGEEVIVKRVERMDGAARFHRDVRIQAPRVLDADGAPFGRALAAALGDATWRKNTVTRDLGTKSFDGVKAEGKLRSYEIPAGEIGNRNPIVVSDETWFAPELQITVYTKHSDPRSGDTVFRLENLKREEPAAALFSVPSDYTVSEAAGRAKRPD